MNKSALMTCLKCGKPFHAYPSHQIRPDHLFLGTQADNVRDREQKGRGAFGKKTQFITENGNAQV